MALENIRIVKKLDAAESIAVRSVYADIECWAKNRGVDILDEDDVATASTLHVAIGGDGTVIHAAKQALECGAPVLGFNLGKVGFLADFDPNRVDATLFAAFEERLAEDERMVIQLGVNGAFADTFLALNDFVISCKYSDTTFKYDLAVDRSYAGTHSANGVIVSTPTGSTAYALSVGGSIVMPSAPDVLQVLPIAAQTLTSRPLIVPADPGVTIKFPWSKDRPVTIRADGQVILEFVMENDETEFSTVTIVPTHKKVRLLHHDSWNHFDVLNQKLNWNK